MMAALTRLAPAALILVAACGAPEAANAPPASRQLAITDGVLDSAHRAVGYLRLGEEGVGCTCTAVGRRTVLAAAHCISPEGGHTVVLEGAAYSASASKRHPKHDPNTNIDDIGVLILERGVHVVPSAVSRKPPVLGAVITLVGFGTSAEGADDAGQKRRANNRVESLHPTSFNFAGTGGGTGNVCAKDSGGPVYHQRDKEAERLVGVVIGGEPPCGTRGGATRADPYISWLQGASGGDLAVWEETRGFGLPCSVDPECKGGICRPDASGDRFCTMACTPGGAPCAEGGACVTAGGGHHCGLPDAPLPDEGCSVSGHRGSADGVAHIVGLLLLLGLMLSRSSCARSI
jgi:Trypsin